MTVSQLIKTLEEIRRRYKSDLTIFLDDGCYDAELTKANVYDIRPHFRRQMRDTPRRHRRVRSNIKRLYIHDYNYYKGNIFLDLS